MSSCTAPSSGKCSASTDNYICKALTYSTSTGLFSGTIVTNTCPNYVPTGSPSATCASYTIPSITTTPSALAFGGQLGFLLNGQLLYGSIEMGISCTTDTTGTCASGLDVATCKNELTVYCPSSYKSSTSMADACCFHASPYHCHTSPSDTCVATSYSSGHSPLIAIANDGRGIYGTYETTNTAPTDLDACNGHVGVISATAGYSGAATGLTGFASGAAVYHYHTSTTFPYTIGCYGSSSKVTYAQCTKLTQTSGSSTYDNSVLCGTYVPVRNTDGTYTFWDDYCQCGAGGTGTHTLSATQAAASTSALCWPYYGGWTQSIAGTKKLYPTSTSGYSSSSCKTTPTVYKVGFSFQNSTTTSVAQQKETHSATVSGVQSQSMASSLAVALILLQGSNYARR